MCNDLEQTKDIKLFELATSLPFRVFAVHLIRDCFRRRQAKIKNDGPLFERRNSNLIRRPLNRFRENIKGPIAQRDIVGLEVHMHKSRNFLTNLCESRKRLH